MDINALKAKEEQIKKLLQEHFETEILSNVGLSSYLIFRDGTLVGAYRHRDMMDYLHDQGVFTDEEIEAYDTTIFNEVFDCVRCSDYTNDENYIGITDSALTEAQYRVLKDWIDNNVEIGRKGVQVTAHFASDNQSSVYYDYSNIIKSGDWPSDYIIFKIKKYYASGKLEEDIQPITALMQPNVHIISHDGTQEIYRLSADTCQYLIDHKHEFFDDYICRHIIPKGDSGSIFSGFSTWTWFYAVRSPESGFNNTLSLGLEKTINPCPQAVVDFIKSNVIEYKDWASVNEDLQPEPITNINAVYHVTWSDMDVYFIPRNLKEILWDNYVKEIVTKDNSNVDEQDYLSRRWLYQGQNSIMGSNILRIIWPVSCHHPYVEVRDRDLYIEDAIRGYGNTVEVGDDEWQNLLHNKIEGNPSYELAEMLGEDLDAHAIQHDELINTVLYGGPTSVDSPLVIDVTYMDDLKEYVKNSLRWEQNLEPELLNAIMNDTDRYQWRYHTYPGQVKNNYGYITVVRIMDNNARHYMLGGNGFGFHPSQEWRDRIIRSTPEVAHLLAEDLDLVADTSPSATYAYMNWGRPCSARTAHMNIINEHFNEKKWFITARCRSANAYDYFDDRVLSVDGSHGEFEQLSPDLKEFDGLMTLPEAFNKFLMLDTKLFDKKDENTFVVHTDIEEKRFDVTTGYYFTVNYLGEETAILFRNCESDETPDMVEDLQLNPYRPLSAAYKYLNYSTIGCEGREQDKQLIDQYRDEKCWFLMARMHAGIFEGSNTIDGSTGGFAKLNPEFSELDGLMTFDEAFEKFLTMDRILFEPMEDGYYYKKRNWGNTNQPVHKNNFFFGVNCTKGHSHGIWHDAIDNIILFRKWDTDDYEEVVEDINPVTITPPAYEEKWLIHTRGSADYEYCKGFIETYEFDDVWSVYVGIADKQDTAAVRNGDWDSLRQIKGEVNFRTAYDTFINCQIGADYDDYKVIVAVAVMCNDARNDRRNTCWVLYKSYRKENYSAGEDLSEELRTGNIKQLSDFLKKKGVDVTSFYNIAESTSHLNDVTDEKKAAYEEAKQDLANIKTKIKVDGYYRGEHDNDSYLIWNIPFEQAQSLALRLLQEDMIHTQISTNTLTATRYKNAQDHDFECFDEDTENGNLVMIADSSTDDFKDRGCTGWPEDKFYFSYNLYREYDSPTDIQKFKNMALDEDLQPQARADGEWAKYLTMPSASLYADVNGFPGYEEIWLELIDRFKDEPVWQVTSSQQSKPLTEHVNFDTAFKVFSEYTQPEGFVDERLRVVFLPTGAIQKKTLYTWEGYLVGLFWARSVLRRYIRNTSSTNEDLQPMPVCDDAWTKYINHCLDCDIDYEGLMLELINRFGDKPYWQTYAYDFNCNKRFIWNNQTKELESSDNSYRYEVTPEYKSSFKDALDALLKCDISENYDVWVSFCPSLGSDYEQPLDMWEGHTADELAGISVLSCQVRDGAEQLSEDLQITTIGRKLTEDVQLQPVKPENWEKYLYCPYDIDDDGYDDSQLGYELIGKYRDKDCWFIRYYEAFGNGWEDRTDTITTFDKAFDTFINTKIGSDDIIDLAFTSQGIDLDDNMNYNLDCWPGHDVFDCDYFTVLSRNIVPTTEDLNLQAREPELPQFVRSLNKAQVEKVKEFLNKLLNDAEFRKDMDRKIPVNTAYIQYTLKQLDEPNYGKLCIESDEIKHRLSNEWFSRQINIYKINKTISDDSYIPASVPVYVPDEEHFPLFDNAVNEDIQPQPIDMSDFSKEKLHEIGAKLVSTYIDEAHSDDDVIKFIYEHADDAHWNLSEWIGRNMLYNLIMDYVTFFEAWTELLRYVNKPDYLELRFTDDTRKMNHDAIIILDNRHLYGEEEDESGSDIQEDIHPQEIIKPDFNKEYIYGMSTDEFEEFVYKYFDEPYWNVRVLDETAVEAGKLVEQTILTQVDYYTAYERFSADASSFEDIYPGHFKTICLDYIERHEPEYDGNAITVRMSLPYYGLLVRHLKPEVETKTEDLQMTPVKSLATLPISKKALNVEQVQKVIEWLQKGIRRYRWVKYGFYSQYQGVPYYKADAEDWLEILNDNMTLGNIESGNLVLAVDIQSSYYGYPADIFHKFRKLSLYRKEGDRYKNASSRLCDAYIPDEDKLPLFGAPTNEDLSLEPRATDIDKYLCNPEARRFIDEMGDEPRWVVLGTDDQYSNKGYHSATMGGVPFDVAFDAFKFVNDEGWIRAGFTKIYVLMLVPGSIPGRERVLNKILVRNLKAPDAVNEDLVMTERTLPFDSKYVDDTSEEDWFELYGRNPITEWNVIVWNDDTNHSKFVAQASHDFEDCYKKFVEYTPTSDDEEYIICGGWNEHGFIRLRRVLHDTPVQPVDSDSIVIEDFNFNVLPDKTIYQESDNFFKPSEKVKAEILRKHLDVIRAENNKYCNFPEDELLYYTWYYMPDWFDGCLYITPDDNSTSMISISDLHGSDIEQIILNSEKTPGTIFEDLQAQAQSFVVGNAMYSMTIHEYVDRVRHGEGLFFVIKPDGTTSTIKAEYAVELMGDTSSMPEDEVNVLMDYLLDECVTFVPSRDSAYDRIDVFMPDYGGSLTEAQLNTLYSNIDLFSDRIFAVANDTATYGGRNLDRYIRSRIGAMVHEPVMHAFDPHNYTISTMDTVHPHDIRIQSDDVDEDLQLEPLDVLKMVEPYFIEGPYWRDYTIHFYPRVIDNVTYTNEELILSFANKACWCVVIHNNTNLGCGYVKANSKTFDEAFEIFLNYNDEDMSEWISIQFEKGSTITPVCVRWIGEGEEPHFDSIEHYQDRGPGFNEDLDLQPRNSDECSYDKRLLAYSEYHAFLQRDADGHGHHMTADEIIKEYGSEPLWSVRVKTGRGPSSTEECPVQGVDFMTAYDYLCNYKFREEHTVDDEQCLYLDVVGDLSDGRPWAVNTILMRINLSNLSPRLSEDLELQQLTANNSYDEKFLLQKKDYKFLMRDVLMVDADDNGDLLLTADQLIKNYGHECIWTVWTSDNPGSFFRRFCHGWVNDILHPLCSNVDFKTAYDCFCNYNFTAGQYCFLDVYNDLEPPEYAEEYRGSWSLLFKQKPDQQTEDLELRPTTRVTYDQAYCLDVTTKYAVWDNGERLRKTIPELIHDYCGEPRWAVYEWRSHAGEYWALKRTGLTFEEAYESMLAYGEYSLTRPHYRCVAIDRQKPGVTGENGYLKVMSNVQSKHPYEVVDEDLEMIPDNTPNYKDNRDIHPTYTVLDPDDAIYKYRTDEVWCFVLNINNTSQSFAGFYDELPEGYNGFFTYDEAYDKLVSFKNPYDREATVELCCKCRARENTEWEGIYAVLFRYLEGKSDNGSLGEDIDAQPQEFDSTCIRHPGNEYNAESWEIPSENIRLKEQFIELLNNLASQYNGNLGLNSYRPVDKDVIDTLNRDNVIFRTWGIYRFTAGDASHTPVIKMWGWNDEYDREGVIATDNIMLLYGNLIKSGVDEIADFLNKNTTQTINEDLLPTPRAKSGAYKYSKKYFNKDEVYEFSNTTQQKMASNELVDRFISQYGTNRIWYLELYDSEWELHTFTNKKYNDYFTFDEAYKLFTEYTYTAKDARNYKGLRLYLTCNCHAIAEYLDGTEWSSIVHNELGIDELAYNYDTDTDDIWEPIGDYVRLFSRPIRSPRTNEDLQPVEPSSAQVEVKGDYYVIIRMFENDKECGKVCKIFNAPPELVFDTQNSNLRLSIGYGAWNNLIYMLETPAAGCYSFTIDGNVYFPEAEETRNTNIEKGLAIDKLFNIDICRKFIDNKLVPGISEIKVDEDFEFIERGVPREGFHLPVIKQYDDYHCGIFFWKDSAICKRVYDLFNTEPIPLNDEDEQSKAPDLWINIYPDNPYKPSKLYCQLWDLTTDKHTSQFAVAIADNNDKMERNNEKALALDDVLGIDICHKFLAQAEDSVTEDIQANEINYNIDEYNREIFTRFLGDFVGPVNPTQSMKGRYEIYAHGDILAITYGNEPDDIFTFKDGAVTVCCYKYNASSGIVWCNALINNDMQTLKNLSSNAKPVSLALLDTYMKKAMYYVAEAFGYNRGEVDEWLEKNDIALIDY